MAILVHEYINKLLKPFFKIRESKIALNQTLTMKLGVTLVLTVTQVYVFVNLRRVTSPATVHLVKESGIKLRHLYVAINVGCSPESGYYVADGNRDGCHWALLFADLEKCKCYYGDSLGWPLPTNFEEVVRPNINKIEEDLQVDLA